MRRFSVPIDRVARVVDVSGSAIRKDESLLPTADGFRQPTAIQSEIRVSLVDNPLMIFEPVTVENGKLLGALLNLWRGFGAG